MRQEKFVVSNWGNYPKITASIKSFKSINDISKEIHSGSGCIVRGNGRCYGDSSLHSNIISSLKYNKILEFNQDEATINCQAGITFDTLIEFLVPRGLFLPVTPGTKFVTVGGAVASDIHGKNHHLDGSFGNYIIKMELLLSSGNIVECGPDHEPELFNSTRGGMGLTGMILSVKFKLKRIGSSFIKQTSIKAKNLDEIFSLFEQYQQSMYSVAWIDCLQQGNSLGRSLLMVGEHAEQKELPPLLRTKPFNSRKKLNIPFNFPAWILNKPSVKLFNFLFYHKQFSKKKVSLVTFDQFFYPLDSIGHWNRAYGKNGFVQYQFVLPLENSKSGLKKILTEIASKRNCSFLAVLKLFGEQEGGLISFPMKGYTLALDFPVQKGLFDFLDCLDRLVLEFGGRIYLTKDARMTKEVFWKSYPEAMKFQEILNKVNPNYNWRSAQSDRLEISKP